MGAHVQMSYVIWAGEIFVGWQKTYVVVRQDDILTEQF
jgi:hypothetical protein